jgi:poly-gamma-glutamate capsule biosynthesis protein CapA/YwtB (metallophosphatase superfamily)
VSLANNHVLDWGEAGLMDTLDHIGRAGIAGAGPDLAAARAPAVLPLPGTRRLLVYARAAGDCGVATEWRGGAGRPGVDRLPDLARERVLALAARIDGTRCPGDLVLRSIHWGGNWGYHVSNAMRQFARSAIDLAGVDLVHGHCPHHPFGIEVHRERLIPYGCGDFLNDYEGIGGHEGFRPELTLMYFPRLATDGRLRGLELVPMRIRHFRLKRASDDEAAWLAAMLNREGATFGTRVEPGRKGSLELRRD